MKLHLESRTLSEQRWFPIFDVLIFFVEEGRHVFALEQAEELVESAWLRSRAASDREVVKLATLKRSHDPLADGSSVLIDQSAPRGGVADENARCTHLHPLDCLAFLSQPFAVIVENEWYDGSFLLWMAKLLGRERLIEAYRDQRFSFRHAGGKDSLARSASVLALGVWPSPSGKRARATQLWAAAVLDNDSKYPSHDPNKAIVEELRQHVSFVYLLQKRAIESYLPYTVLQRLDSSAFFKDRVDALFRMTKEQRCHYHMKYGFRLKGNVDPDRSEYLMSDEIASGEKSLFGNIPEEDWAKLAAGFGGGLAGVFTSPNLRPNNADREAMDEESRAEISQLLDAIYERI